ncbi:alpha/beta fold hydrolase [Sinosporangium siamense]|uniref:AB hydrolase-1 domain-containing protein n=1 Tax=Sinosporangium siamense TaxID=1367973 RepID=A0A919RNA5_9ACTN|nr:alpha/beta fold hydrolase [Sinosporangium siamense]GII95336.1 hypothetical protein Ssi02_55670 [Sinosporangium siamense]
MVAQEYALAGAAGLAGLVLADTSPDLSMYLREGWRIRLRLPGEVRAVLDRHEEAGTTDSPEYAAAYQIYLNRFTCKLRPVPEAILRGQAGGNPEISRVMWGGGGRSFQVDGRLRGWSVLSRLGGIGVPTLVITGSDDMASPAIAATMAAAIPDARLVVVEGGSHTPFYEDPQGFCGSVSDFLTELDAAAV